MAKLLITTEVQLLDNQNNAHTYIIGGRANKIWVKPLTGDLIGIYKTKKAVKQALINYHYKNIFN